jgi:Uncharacterized protein conserved in bacteria (DUF2213)
MPRSQSLQAQVQNDLIQFATHEGQEYLVAPCVAIVPGVLNGALVPMQAIADTFSAWNGRPIVVNHPTNEDGTAVSANEPSVVESVGIGTIWHATTDDDRLRVEAWVNTAKAQALGGEAATILERLRNKEPTEVSTGYWAVMRDVKGQLNGESYDEVTELIIPDHLAFLPNAIGACNWGDGCGVPRLNQEAPVATSPTHNMTVTDQFEILASMIGREAEAENIELWRWHIIDIENDSVVMIMDGRLMRRSFTVTASDDLEWNGEWEEVNRKTTFTPAAAQCACGRPLTQEEEPSVSDQPESVDTLAQYLATQGVTQDELQAALQARSERRQSAINTIVEHAGLNAADLQGLSDAALTVLAAKVQPAQAEPPKVEMIPNTASENIMADYIGRGQPGQPAKANAVPERPRILRAAPKMA